MLFNTTPLRESNACMSACSAVPACLLACCGCGAEMRQEGQGKGVSNDCPCQANKAAAASAGTTEAWRLCTAAACCAALRKHPRSALRVPPAAGGGPRVGTSSTVTCASSHRLTGTARLHRLQAGLPWAQHHDARTGAALLVGRPPCPDPPSRPARVHAPLITTSTSPRSWKAAPAPPASLSARSGCVLHLCRLPGPSASPGPAPFTPSVA